MSIRIPKVLDTDGKNKLVIERIVFNEPVRAIIFEVVFIVKQSDRFTTKNIGFAINERNNTIAEPIDNSEIELIDAKRIICFIDADAMNKFDADLYYSLK